MVRALAVAMILLVGACSSAAKAPATPPTEPPATPVGEVCGGETCAPPARCITVVGMQPDSAHDECWITCGGGEACPAGMTCTMIHDGPGQVCEPADRE